MSTLVGTDEFVILTNSGSLIRCALRRMDVLTSVLASVHPDDIQRIHGRLEKVRQIQRKRLLDAQFVAEPVSADTERDLLSIDSDSGLDINDNKVVELLTNSAQLIRAALLRREVLESIYLHTHPDDFDMILSNLSDICALQNRRLREAIRPPSNVLECTREIKKLLTKYSASLEQVIQALHNEVPQPHGQIIRFEKDGVCWTGQGRRPLVYKGLTSIDLERYRIDAIGYQKGV